MKSRKSQIGWKRSFTLAGLLGSLLVVPVPGETAQAASATVPMTTTVAAPVDVMNAPDATSATCRRRRRVSYYRGRRVTYVRRRPRNSRYVGSRIIRRNGRLYRVRYYVRR